MGSGDGIKPLVGMERSPPTMQQFCGHRKGRWESGMAKAKQQTDSADYPPAFLEGLRLYWQGCYWHSHEAWEELWRQADEPERSFLKALIQIDAALIHAERGDWQGVSNLLRRVMGYLAKCPDKVLGVPVPPLRLQVATLRREVDALLQGRKRQFNWYLKPRITPEGIEPPRRERLRRSPEDRPMREGKRVVRDV
jgi:predicted metal-dependent hydrolase